MSKITEAKGRRQLHQDLKECILDLKATTTETAKGLKSLPVILLDYWKSNPNIDLFEIDFLNNSGVLPGKGSILQPEFKVESKAIIDRFSIPGEWYRDRIIISLTLLKTDSLKKIGFTPEQRKVIHDYIGDHCKAFIIKLGNSIIGNGWTNSHTRLALRLAINATRTDPLRNDIMALLKQPSPKNYEGDGGEIKADDSEPSRETAEAEKEEAATTIQSMFRGRKVRSEIKAEEAVEAGGGVETKADDSKPSGETAEAKEEAAAQAQQAVEAAGAEEAAVSVAPESLREHLLAVMNAAQTAISHYTEGIQQKLTTTLITKDIKHLTEAISGYKKEFPATFEKDIFSWINKTSRILINKNKHQLENPELNIKIRKNIVKGFNSILRKYKDVAYESVVLPAAKQVEAVAVADIVEDIVKNQGITLGDVKNIEKSIQKWEGDPNFNIIAKINAILQDRKNNPPSTKQDNKSKKRKSARKNNKEVLRTKLNELQSSYPKDNKAEAAKAAKAALAALPLTSWLLDDENKNFEEADENKNFEKLQLERIVRVKEAGEAAAKAAKAAKVATTIQSLYRDYKVRVAAQQAQAATKIQSLVRDSQGRAAAQQEKKAATTIQSLYSDYKVRVAAQQAQAQAATKIQSLVRDNQGRARTVARAVARAVAAAQQAAESKKRKRTIGALTIGVMCFLGGVFGLISPVIFAKSSLLTDISNADLEIWYILFAVVTIIAFASSALAGKSLYNPAEKINRKRIITKENPGKSQAVKGKPGQFRARQVNSGKTLKDKPAKKIHNQ